MAGPLKSVLFIDWVDHRKFAVDKKAAKGDSSIEVHLNKMLNVRADAQRFEGDRDAAETVRREGLLAKTGWRGLPMGRIARSMPEGLVFARGDCEAAFLVVLAVRDDPASTAAASVRVRGEFRDVNARKLASFDAASTKAMKNGVHLLRMPAPAAAKPVGEVEGFGFKLVEAKTKA